MLIEKYRLLNISEVNTFDCGVNDLNEFLLKDALDNHKELFAVTYIIKVDNVPAAYFSVLNDNIHTDELDHKNKFNRSIPNKKRRKEYPSVKIGRLAVNKTHQSFGIGALILDHIKFWFVDNNKTGCRFLTVDAHNNERTISFYCRNGFKFFTLEDSSEDTRSMYYDLIEIIKKMNESPTDSPSL